MFEVYVCSLGGTRRCVELYEGMTIGDLRAQLEAELPKFHAVRLMQDGHERRNEAAINVGKLSVDITMLVTSCM